MQHGRELLHCSMTMRGEELVGASTQKYGANCDTSVKIWTNEGYIKLIRFRPGATLAKYDYRLNFNKIQDGGQITEKYIRMAYIGL